MVVQPCYFIMPEQHVVSCLNNVLESTSCFTLFQHAWTTCSNEKLVEQHIVLALPSTINQNKPIGIERTYNQPITFFVYDSKIMEKAVKVHLFSDDKPCNFLDNMSGITCLIFTAQIINFEIYLVQDTGTEFFHEKTQYNDVKTKDDKSITKRQRQFIQRETSDCRKELSFHFFSRSFLCCLSISKACLISLGLSFLWYVFRVNKHSYQSNLIMSLLILVGLASECCVLSLGELEHSYIKL